MIIVCNSSPIIALTSVNRLDILNELFSDVLIPQAVYDEVFLMKNKATPKADFIKVRQVENKNLVNVLNLYLDLGESEVIAFALENGIDRVILDDKQARKIAEKQGLKLIGTVGILILAKEKGIVNEVRPLIVQMRKRINFRISQEIVNKVLSMLNESIL